MSDVVKVLESPDGRERIVVAQRSDGRFTYRKQWLEAHGWSAEGIDSGIYDDAVTAETEAMLRVNWLRQRFS